MSKLESCLERQARGCYEVRTDLHPIWRVFDPAEADLGIGALYCLPFRDRTQPLGVAKVFPEIPAPCLLP
jgi:hypothetical protein